MEVSTFRAVIMGNGTLWLVKFERPIMDASWSVTPPSGPYKS